MTISGLKMAQAIAAQFDDAMFCFFEVSGSKKQPLQRDGMLGVGADTPPGQLVSAAEVLAGSVVTHGQYWGVVMQHPVTDFLGNALTVLDLDGKHCPAGEPYAAGLVALKDKAKGEDWLREVSHSRKGAHIMLAAPPDVALPGKVNVGTGQDIEIFGHPGSPGKSVMLTDTKLSGDLRSVESVADMFTELGISLSGCSQGGVATTIDGPMSQTRIVNTLALAHLGKWVPVLWPDAVDKGKSGWRVSSVALGRDLEEDLSFHKDGIKDFGVHDQDDPRHGKRTAIDVVSEWVTEGNWRAAADRLRELLGLPAFRKEMSDLENAALNASPTQDNVAMAFEQIYKGQFLYAHQFGQWMEYDGKRWLADPTSRVFELVRQLARRINAGVQKDPTKASFYKGVLTITQYSPTFSVLGSEFDANTELMNTPAGVLDLATGLIREHDPAMRLSKITAVAPETAGGELFLNTLMEICDGDGELAEFHQMSLGAILSGAIEEHWLLYWFGLGRNGKNLLADLVFEVLGDYSHRMPAASLMSRKNEEHPTAIAALAGSRLVMSSEVPSDAFWNTALIKELSGDAALTGRLMRQDFFTFKRTHKHLVLGNYRPQIRDSDGALKSRLKLVPFNVSFAGRENVELPSLLRSESGFVLQWLIDGHLKWRANGKRLPRCAAVEAASADYFAAQSTTEMWLTDCCYRKGFDAPPTPCGWTQKASELYSNYSQWKQSRGESPSSQTRWGEEMQRFGLAKTKTMGVIVYQNVALRSEFAFS